ncbi:hypothetical protein CQW23_24222 [Capsicum baccatum]|uniref:ATP-grasp domain-containing protein n=1 Tax=Capsicum baccatum TaxID=33114 RepID=A0A2G2VU86_CAPBA|nr:hypothetical protein CQW23_24222 [Capsicum baccatum]
MSYGGSVLVKELIEAIEGYLIGVLRVARLRKVLLARDIKVAGRGSYWVIFIYSSLLTCMSADTIAKEKLVVNGFFMKILLLSSSSSNNSKLSCERSRGFGGIVKASSVEEGDDLHVSCYYIDSNLNAFAISTAQVSSNAPADFDFKLERTPCFCVDIVFPVIHGRFGEDGGIQELMERSNISFVGTGSTQCQKAFDKYDASLELDRQGFTTVPNFLIQGNEMDESELSRWFEQNLLDMSGKVVVKPTRAGSSIGVTVAYGVTDSLKKGNRIISEGIDDKVLIEVFLEGGSEFTAIVLDVGSGFDCQPVVLLPTEVELQSHGTVDVGEKDAIFNYRRKYLPTRQVELQSHGAVDVGEKDAIVNYRRKYLPTRQELHYYFSDLGLRDFARIDGWLLPPSTKSFTSAGNKFGRTDSGTVIFIDINLVSGMEQTSFLFQQASKVGFSHSNILRTIFQHACLRFPDLLSHNIISNPSRRRSKSSSATEAVLKQHKKVYIIFGGDTSERQVSLISGTNVWLNLKASDDLKGNARCSTVLSCKSPTIVDCGGFTTRAALSCCLSYSLLLRHTTEEVLDACLEAIEPNRAALTSHLRNLVMDDLTRGLRKHSWFNGFDISDELPKKFSLEQWVKLAKESQATVFIAVHGGIGEDGTLQSLLEAEGIPFTVEGPGAMSSKTCMDKVATSLALHHVS